MEKKDNYKRLRKKLIISDLPIKEKIFDIISLNLEKKTSILKQKLHEYKSWNMKLFLGKEWIIKTEDQLKKLIKSRWSHNIRHLLKFGKLENMKLFFGPNWFVKDYEDLEYLMNSIHFKNILYFVERWQLDNMKLFFSDKFYNVNNIKNLETLMDNSYWNHIWSLIESWKPENIKYFFWENWLIQNKIDLESTIASTNREDIGNLIKFGELDYISLFFGKNSEVKNIQDLEWLINNPNWNDIKYHLINGTCSLKPILKWLSYDNFDKNENLLKDNLFKVKTQWSKIFDYLSELMKKNPDKDIYELIDTDIDKKIQEYTHNLKKYTLEERNQNFEKIKPMLEKNIEWKSKIIDKTKISQDKLYLSTYLRYWRTVDYPEIWEYIILFLNKYINQWYSKYISWIRLIPRHKNVFPRGGFFENNKIRKFNVEWDEFRNALNQYGVPFYFSHSRCEAQKNFPNIISWSMKWNESSINSWIELQSEEDESDIHEKNLDDILKQIISIMQELDQQIFWKIEIY